MRYLSLFSGIGGFEYGIHQSNKSDKLVNCGFSEIDKYAKNIYKKHYPNHTDLGDVTKIRTEDLPSFDFLVGGFPCQAFSVAGKRRGFSDTRGTLFFEIARILRDKKPKYFLLENVKGLLSHDKGRTFQTILRTLSELGYDVQWEIFNSKNHGVPQNRERIYIKGFLRTRCGQEILSLRKAGATVDARQRETGEHIESVQTNKGNITFTKMDEISKATTTGNGDFYAVTTHHRGMDFAKKQDNYIITKPIKLNDKAQGQAIYSEEGVSVTLSANGGGQGGKTGLYMISTEKNDRIIKVGNIRPNQKSQSGTVYDEKGISSTITSDKPLKILLRNNTRKGYAEASDGDGFVINQYNCRGRVQKESVPTLNTGDGCGAGTFDGYIVRRLTPVETERLQGFPKIEKTVVIKWQNIPQTIAQNVADKKQKNPKPVGNVGKTKSRKNVKFVEKNSHPKNQKIKKLVPKNVHIHLEDGTVHVLNPKRSSSNVNGVEKKNLFHQHIKQEDFVHLNVLMNSILDQIILSGKEELLQNEHYSIHQKNGKIIVNISGKETTQLVNFVEEDITMLEKHLKSTTLSLLDTETFATMLTTWFYYVILVIIGYIPEEMNINCLEFIEITEKSGWTEYGADGSLISDTQRYKCCGNAVTTNVVRDILDTWDMVFE